MFLTEHGNNGCGKKVSYFVFVQFAHSAGNKHLCAARKTKARHKQHRVENACKANGIQFYFAKFANKNGIEYTITRPRNVSQYQWK